MSKSKKKPELNLFCSYEEHSQVISDTRGEDGPYSGHAETSTTSSLIGVHKDKPGGCYYYLVPVKDWDGKTEPKKVFAVCVHYSTGDTFSHESGLLAIEGLYMSMDAASKVAQQIRDNTYKDYGAWQGYFESLEQVYVQTEDVGEPKKVYF